MTDTRLTTLVNEAIQAYQGGKFQAVEQIVPKALEIDAKHPIANQLMGLVRSSQGMHEVAKISFMSAVEGDPTFPEAWFCLGATYQALQEQLKALEAYEKAVALKPDYWVAFSNTGIILESLGRYSEALSAHERALAVADQVPEVWLNLGTVLYRLERYEEALGAYSKALQLNENLPTAWFNAGLAFQALRQFEQAFGAYRKTLELDANNLDAWLNTGLIFQELGQYEEALVAYYRVLEASPTHSQALFNAGSAYTELKKYDEAIECLEKAKKSDGKMNFLLGNLHYAKMAICDWSGAEAMHQDLIAGINQGMPVIHPFAALVAFDDEALQQRTSQIWTSKNTIKQDRLDKPKKFGSHTRLKVAYFSAEFREHPVAILIAGVIEKHHHDLFETYAFSYGPKIEDAMRKRLESGFNHFIDVSEKSDQDVAKLARELEIDIAIDLTGYTRFSRTGIFAHRAAPIQVNFLGYPGTLSAPYMDYIIADQTVIPQEAQQYYGESIVYLPNTYQPNDRHREVASDEVTRSQFGLPNQGFVYCCFNNNFKITPKIFDIWMRVLIAVPDSVLWLFEDNPSAARNLKNEAQRRGVHPDRIIFAQKLPLTQHLARYRLADLFLDTLPYSAHTTASDALWMGLPVLTCLGKSFAGRVAASLLKTINLPELIATDMTQYEALAIDLGQHPERIVALRAKINEQRLSSPLFDAELFVADLEQAYQKMVQRYQQGLSPATLEISD